MRRFQELTDGPTITKAVNLLKWWGYPREPSLSERCIARWFMYGPDCIFWLERVRGDEFCGILHLAVAPATRKQHGIAPRKLFRHLPVFVDLCDFDRLIANDCTESGEVTDYLVRLGWKPCVMDTIEGEWYERSFVDGEAQGESHEQASETQDCPSERGGGQGSEARSEREGAQESGPAARTGRERLRTP